MSKIFTDCSSFITHFSRPLEDESSGGFPLLPPPTLSGKLLGAKDFSTTTSSSFSCNNVARTLHDFLQTIVQRREGRHSSMSSSRKCQSTCKLLQKSNQTINLPRFQTSSSRLQDPLYSFGSIWAHYILILYKLSS